MVMPLGFGDLLFGADRTPIQIHQLTVRRGVRKHHAAAAPIARWVWPAARRRRAHAALLRQRQGNAALLQVGGAAAPRQGGLERGDLLGEVGPCWDWRLRCRWMCRELPGGCHWWPRSQRWRLSTAWHALPAGQRPLEGRLALLFFAPL